MILTTVLVTLVAIDVLLGVAIYMVSKRLGACEQLLEMQDVSIRRLNHRVIGEQRPVKGLVIPDPIKD